jgi:YebC/PmpR family DNA-binding regulatory protein
VENEMAGHSKWKNIKHKKAAADSDRAKKFGKLLKEIYVSAKIGGGDLDSNPNLRMLIQKAQEINMPKGNYIRAIRRGTGEIEGAAYEHHLYEGYGPGGTAIIAEVLTDNKNRAVSTVRSAFTHNYGHLAELGAVSWMFDKKGIITILSKTLTEDDLVEILLDYHIDNISKSDNEINITCNPGDLQKIRAVISNLGHKVDETYIGYISKTIMNVSDDDFLKASHLLETIESLEDVQRVYANI